MALTSHQGTLSFQLARPLCAKRVARDVRLPALVAAIKPHYEGASDSFGSNVVHPETEALRFYLLQHAMAEIRTAHGPDEVLPPATLEVVEAYHRESNALAVRMFYYLVLICTREARHVQGGSSWYAQVDKQYGSEIASFLRSLPSSSSGAANKLMSDAPDVPLGRFVDALTYTFQHGSWGSQFGGSAWADISEALGHFVDGTFSAEMLLDRAFNLAHNTAPIFNKGMLFQHQAGHGSELRVILDVQASGFIPQFIAEYRHKLATRWAKNGVRDLLKLCAKVTPAFDGIVDWFQVEAMGKGHYSNEKSAQIAEHGEGSSEYAKVAAKKAAEAEAKKAATQFEIHSSLTMQKVAR